MINIRGIDIDFNITSPADIRKLHTAQTNADARHGEIQTPTDISAPDYMLKYADWLDSLLYVYGNFIDDAFGDGVAKKLLTLNPSLDLLFQVNEDLEKALGAHVNTITSSFAKYKPDRSKRRK